MCQKNHPKFTGTTVCVCTVGRTIEGWKQKWLDSYLHGLDRLTESGHSQVSCLGLWLVMSRTASNPFLPGTLEGLAGVNFLSYYFYPRQQICGRVMYPTRCQIYAVFLRTLISQWIANEKVTFLALKRKTNWRPRSIYDWMLPWPTMWWGISEIECKLMYAVNNGQHLNDIKIIWR